MCAALSCGEQFEPVQQHEQSLRDGKQPSDDVAAGRTVTEADRRNASYR